MRLTLPVLTGLALLQGAGLAWATPTTSFVLSVVGTPGAYTRPDLQALPPTTVTSTYYRGTTPAKDTDTGVLVNDLLHHAGGVTVDTSRKNVVATGTDGLLMVPFLGILAARRRV